MTRQYEIKYFSFKFMRRFYHTKSTLSTETAKKRSPLFFLFFSIDRYGKLCYTSVDLKVRLDDM